MTTFMKNLVNPVILELHFKTTSTGGIAIGQWVVLFDEIPARKIGEDIFEVYPEAEVLEVETFEDRVEKLVEQLKHWDEPHKILPPMLAREILPTPKYVKTSKGSKRMRPWEGPQYF